MSAPYWPAPSRALERARPWSAHWAPVFLAVLASACGPRAILELELELPAQPAGAPLFASVEASAEEGLEGAPFLVGIPLPAACARTGPPPPCALRTLDARCGHVVSVLAGGAPLERPLQVNVRFCTDPECVGEAAPPTYAIELERAFYEGRYTQARACIDLVPTAPGPAPERIERCEVRCREGTSANSCRLDGTHFCE